MQRLSAAAGGILKTLETRGLMLLQDARLPSVVAELVGGPINGSRRAHRASHAIYGVLDELSEHAAVCIRPPLRAEQTLISRAVRSARRHRPCPRRLAVESPEHGPLGRPGLGHRVRVPMWRELRVNVERSTAIEGYQDDSPHRLSPCVGAAAASATTWPAAVYHRPQPMVSRARGWLFGLGIGVLLASLCGPHAPARAQPASDARFGLARGDDAIGYALLVGSNPGGRGQRELRYAETDAERVAGLLRELGGYERRRMTLLRSPGRVQLLARLELLAQRLRAHAAAQEPTKLFFYYSGHARAGAINLGHDEVALSELRERLLALPTEVTLVVLDACQSGAFSRIKGAEPAASFSINSVSRLAASGVAVMASSSALELSQESAELESSYFTHHLLVGLRGAADRDGDGRVTLSEAYGYGRAQTLLATAATQVGAQHVTLETDLRGKGELILSYPALASSHVRLGRELEADVLIAQRASGNVLAEVNKAAGESLAIALPAGRYQVWLRQSGSARRCDLTLRRSATAELRPEECQQVELASATPKSSAIARELWSFELGLGVGGSRTGAFGRRLSDFGFVRVSPEQSSLGGDGDVRVGLAVGFNLDRHLGLGLYFQNLDASEYLRDERVSGGTVRSRFSWSAYMVGLSVRGLLPLLDGALTPYAQVGAGLALGFSELEQTTREGSSERFVGYHLAGALGVQFMPIRHLGLFAEFGYAFAPAVDNLLGDTHDSGGHALRLGLRASTWSRRR